MGNVFFNRFVDPTPRLESLAAGADSLPVVVPANANLMAQFAITRPAHLLPSFS
jgi:hypothetical protein